MSVLFSNLNQLLGPWEIARSALIDDLTTVQARLAPLNGITDSVTVPYVPGGVFITDSQGHADFSRLPMINVPFNSSYFGANTGTWTVTASQYKSFRYLVLGQLMFLRVYISNSSTSAGMGNMLTIQLPSGWRTLDNGYYGPVSWTAATAAVNGTGVILGNVSPADNSLTLQRDTNASPTVWPSNEASTFTVGINLTIPVFHPTLRPLQSGDKVS